MASYRSHAATPDISAVSWDVANAAGVAAGDVLIAFLATWNVNAALPDAPDGWTNHGGHIASGSQGSSVWTKVAGAAEPASYAFDWTLSEDGTAVIIAVQGGDAADPINAVAIGATPSGTTHAGPAATTDADGCLIVTGIGALADEAVTTTPPAGFAERFEAGAGILIVSAADDEQGAAGAVDLSWASSVAATGVVFVVAVAPEGSSALDPATVAGSRYYQRLRARRGR